MVKKGEEMSVKRRVSKLEKRLRKKGKVPPNERVRIFFDDGNGSDRAEMAAEEARLMKKYNSDGSELLLIESAVPEPKPRPE